jgi:molecular chaperone IbpA
VANPEGAALWVPLVNGLLTIDLQREIPDEMKPRRIWIQAIASPPQAEPRQIDEQKRAA